MKTTEATGLMAQGRKEALITFCLTSAWAILIAGLLLTANNAFAASTDAADETSAAAGAPDIIFSNLERSPGNRYNGAGLAIPMSGKFGEGDTERWDAVRFVPKVDVQATVLTAAIGYISGTKLIKLGIYSNDEASNTVGDPLPGGQGSTAQIPDEGSCCQLAKVTLAGEGVTLTGGTAYWLVGKTDDNNAPDFNGVWRVSNLGNSAYLQPPFPWNPQGGNWPAAQIRGKRLQALAPAKAPNSDDLSSRASAATNVTIFSNIDHASTEQYFTGFGEIIAGKTSFAGAEVWEALPFTPRADVHAKTLAAAIARVSGTKGVNLAIYSDNGGVPGTLLPGGQGSTADFPDSGECCDLARVELAGSGVALTAGTQYWLVASPDNVNAPDFQGFWQWSVVAIAAYKEPTHLDTWIDSPGAWLAAEIRGTRP